MDVLNKYENITNSYYYVFKCHAAATFKSLTVLGTYEYVFN
jgi:hypothetical protein